MTVKYIAPSRSYQIYKFPLSVYFSVENLTWLYTRKQISLVNTGISLILWKTMVKIDEPVTHSIKTINSNSGVTRENTFYKVNVTVGGVNITNQELECLYQPWSTDLPITPRQHASAWAWRNHTKPVEMTHWYHIMQKWRWDQSSGSHLLPHKWKEKNVKWKKHTCIIIKQQNLKKVNNVKGIISG